MMKKIIKALYLFCKYVVLTVCFYLPAALLLLACFMFVLAGEFLRGPRTFKARVKTFYKEIAGAIKTYYLALSQV